MEYFPAHHNPNPNYTHLIGHLDQPEFNFFDYLMPDYVSEEDSTSTFVECPPENPILPENVNDNNLIESTGAITPMSINNINEVKKLGFRIALRTKSEFDNMDDGFKWRKYGKKTVKSSPNPRNYFRCSSRGCDVKKRVERDGEDSSYVITSYEGVHNHESPCVVYYNQTPLMVPPGWTLQAFHTSSSS